MPFGRQDGGLNPHPSDENQFQPTNQGDVGVTFEICITPGVVDDKAAELERLATGPVHVFGKVIYAGHADEDRVALLVGGAGGGGSAGKFHKHVRTQSTTVLLT